MSEEWAKRGARAAEAVKRGAESAANGLHGLTSEITKREFQVSDATTAATQAIGSVLDNTGRTVSAVGNQASRYLHDNAQRNADAVKAAIIGAGNAGAWRTGAARIGWMLTKAGSHVGGLAATIVEKAGDLTAATGRVTGKAAPAVGGAAGGAMRGAAELASNTLDATILPASRIDDMRRELRTLGEMELEECEARIADIKRAQGARRKDELLDLLMVGEFVLSKAIADPAGVPREIQKAFEYAYPGLAQHESFAQAVSRMSSDELLGLTSGVKGKLFELELVDHLNGGGLPEGFSARLAESATQPGWDIQVLDDHGQVSDLLQAKATESANYVTDAIERYPGIDVTTTTEVHAQLVALGLAQHVQDSGISDAALQAKVETAMHAGSATLSADDFVPSSIGLAVIALSVFMNRSTSLRDKGAALGTRSAKAGVSGAIGKATLLATQTWWLGLIAGVGARWLAGHGSNKREEYQALKAALVVMRKRYPALAQSLAGGAHN